MLTLRFNYNDALHNITRVVFYLPRLTPPLQNTMALCRALYGAMACVNNIIIFFIICTRVYGDPVFVSTNNNNNNTVLGVFASRESRTSATPTARDS